MSDPNAPAAVVRTAGVVAGDPAWRLALPALVVTLAGLLWIFRDTATAMVEIWARSDTFAHGFVVLPIVFWLVWRMRGELAGLAPRPNPWGMLALALAGLAWLVAELATVNAGKQFALVALLVLTVPTVLGIGVARKLMFPLAFTFFAVPFGEFAMPQLMDWTADFVVVGLRLSGVPVYREGLHLVIPSGNWSVIEACSGVRYLIASLTVGTLFAYVSYRSRMRQLIFIGVSLLVPIVANWLRAYMIVMLGHLSGNRLAVGVDHLIYGWVFFGVVILLMFWIGSRWREDHIQDPTRRVVPQPPAANAAAAAPARLARIWLVAVLAVALSAVWPAWSARIAQTDAATETGVDLDVPGRIGGWIGRTEPLSDWRPHFENAVAERHMSFVDGERVVGVYVGYYRRQDAGRKLVSSSNVLVPSTHPVWARVSSGTTTALLDGQAQRVRSAELRRSSSERLLAWQWYWVDGRPTASDSWAKIQTVVSRLSGRGDDGAVIVVYAPTDPAGSGEAVLADFARTAWPAIEGALRRAKDGR